MEYLQILRDKDIFPNKEFPEVKEWVTRKTVKIILLNSEGKIALVTNPTHKCFILPGGGIDEGENIYAAADRESQEEVGFSIEPIATIGATLEYRGRDGKLYETHGVVARVKDATTEDLRTGEEKANNITSSWFSREEVASLFQLQKQMVRAGKIDFYNIGFNIIRDSIFLDTAQKNKLI